MSGSDEADGSVAYNRTRGFVQRSINRQGQKLQTSQKSPKRTIRNRYKELLERLDLKDKLKIKENEKKKKKPAE